MLKAQGATESECEDTDIEAEEKRLEEGKTGTSEGAHKAKPPLGLKIDVDTEKVHGGKKNVGARAKDEEDDGDDEATESEYQSEIESEVESVAEDDIEAMKARLAELEELMHEGLLTPKEYKAAERALSPKSPKNRHFFADVEEEGQKEGEEGETEYETATETEGEGD